MPPATITTQQRRSLVAAIVEPSAAVVIRSERRTARLLSTVLVLLAPMALLSMVLQLIVLRRIGGIAIALAVAIVAIVGTYVLSRTRHFRLAGAITTLIPTAAGLAVLVAVNDDPGWYAFMGLNPALGALFVPVRWALFLATINLAAVIGGVLAVPSLEADAAIVAVMFNAIIAIVLLTAAVFRNLLEQDRQADLLARQRLQQNILDSTFGGMAIIRDGVITDANHTFADLVALEPGELIGARLDDVFDTEMTRSFDDTIGRDIDNPVEIATVRRDGTPLDVEIVVRHIDDDERDNVVLAVRDISDRKAADRALLRAQRMESVGRLAAGLTHDTGNELLVISALADQLKRERHESGLDVDTVERIEDAANRVASMIRRVLLVGREEQSEPNDIDIGAFLAQSGPMWRQVLGDKIELRVDGHDTGHLRLHRGSFEQLFLNLVLNARDALPSGGSVTIRASTVTVPDTQTTPDGLAAGRYHQLTIADDGAGIADDHLPRVFDPFFTTKDHDRGTGLGLFTSRSVVRQAGGEMTVSSDGHGSVFTVYLPAHEP